MLSEAAVNAVAKRALPGPPPPRSARIVLHFHPDVDLWGRPVLERLVRDGVYLPQLATGTSNGGLTAVAGGDRWRWEHQIFDGIYDHAEPSEHPVYGALAVDADPYGAAARFGSSYLRLRPHVITRSTFAYPDSVFEPSSFGVGDQMGLIDLWRQDRPTDPLDHYIEAHVHGGVRLTDDVEAIVLDPSFRGSAVQTMARAAGMAVEWHPGYVLSTDGLAGSASYRGPLVAEAARSRAQGGGHHPGDPGAGQKHRSGGSADAEVVVALSRPVRQI